MIWRAALLLLVAAPGPACSCAAGHEPVEPHDGTEPQGLEMEVELSASAPQERLPLPAFATAPTVLQLAITAIDNPKAQAFAVSASLQPPGGVEGGVPIGTFAPFPVDQPGTFVLPLPAPAQEVLAGASEGLALRLALEPMLPERPLVEPLRVSLAEPTWQ